MSPPRQLASGRLNHTMPAGVSQYAPPWPCAMVQWWASSSEKNSVSLAADILRVGGGGGAVVGAAVSAGCCGASGGCVGCAESG
jgi:hypothetical protein